MGKAGRNGWGIWMIPGEQNLPNGLVDRRCAYVQKGWKEDGRLFQTRDRLPIWEGIENLTMEEFREIDAAGRMIRIVDWEKRCPGYEYWPWM